jgi:hypothetical protein
MNRYSYPTFQRPVTPLLLYGIGDRVKPNMQLADIGDVPERARLKGTIIAITSYERKAYKIRWDGTGTHGIWTEESLVRE